MDDKPHEPPAFVKQLVTSPPAALYHYTGQVGLLGIVERAELWATKIQYMNDATEFGLALRMARNQLQKIIDSDLHQTMEKSAAVKLLESLRGIEDINIFTACFCENGDLLSQWRGYSGGRYGYAIGFSSDALIQIADESNFTLGHCIYDGEIQRNIVEQAVAHCLQNEADFTADKRWGFHGPLADFLFRYGVFFKDASFKDEKEWRLVSRTTNYRAEQLRFREGRSTIIPYYALSIRGHGNKPIKHIVVGPCPHMELSKFSITTLLMRHGNLGPLRGEQVAVGSTIPFRDW